MATEKSESGYEKDGIKFSRIPGERAEEVMAFLYENFFPDEPICRSLGVKQHWLLDKYHIDAINAGSCVMATDSEGNLLGVRLADIVNRDSWIDWFVEKLFKNWIPKFWWMFEQSWQNKIKVFGVLMAQLGTDSWNLFRQFNCNRILSAICLCTNKNIRSKGLGTELVRYSEQVAKEDGCQYACVIVTGIYSGKIFAKSGYSILNEIVYADFKDENGELYLNDTREHTTCRFTIKSLLDNEETPK